jgi:DNA-binding NtrC family response regulator
MEVCVKTRIDGEKFDAPGQQRLRVLVVEDETLLRWSISEVLRQHGHEVTEAVSASSARAAMSGSALPFDAVLLDLRLPDSSDLALLEETRRRLPRSGVVLMTAYGAPELIQGALRLGAYRVVSKPFDMQDVVPLVRHAYEAAR